MIIDFPTNPAEGQEFTDHNNVIWVFRNNRWRRNMPSVIAGTPNYYRISTDELVAATPAVPWPPNTPLLDTIPDRLTDFVSPENPVDGMMFYVSKSQAPGAQNDGAGVWRFTVDPTANINNWVRIMEPGTAGVEKVASHADVLAIANPAPGDLVLTLDTHTLYIYAREYLGMPPSWVESWREFLPLHNEEDYLQRLAYDPEMPVGNRLRWMDDREAMGLVQNLPDLSNRNLLPASHMSIGKLVYVVGEGTIYRLDKDPRALTNTDDDWSPLVSGLTYVGRAGNLPQKAEHGEMFIVRMDFNGEPLYRLLAWDETIVNRTNYLPMSALSHTLFPNPATSPISPPDDLTITFSLPTNSALGQTGTYGFRLSWEEDSQPFTQSFVVPVTPGMTALDVASTLEAEFKAQLPRGELAPTQVGSVLTLTPRPAVPPINAANDIGPIATSSALPATPSVGDWAEVTGAIQLNGMPVPAGSTIFYVGGNLGMNGWVIQHPSFSGGVTLNVAPGGNPANFGASLTFAGAGNLSYFGPASAGNWTAGDYLIASAPFTFPAADPVAYPTMGNLAGQTVAIGDFLVFESGTDQWLIVGTADHDNAAIRAAYNMAGSLGATQQVTLGGVMTVAPTPPAAYQPPNTSPHHVIITNVIEASMASGPLTTPTQGGWRHLNRKVWGKDARADADQNTDQQPGDLQITHEDQHEEIKAWNPGARQWDLIYSRDEVNAAIAAMSLFEGTVQEVGGGAIGAVEFDDLPDLVAMSAAGDLSDVSHYWTFVGSPNTQVTAATPAIGPNLNGAILNPGDWVQIANRGGDGSGVGSNGGAVDLQWVTIGGDLLAKARADRLFGLQPWAAGGWEQGSLVLFNGDVYRADQPVTANDPDPSTGQATITPVSLPVHEATAHDTWVDQLGASFPAGAAVTAGMWIDVQASVQANVGGPFSGRAVNPGDRFVWVGPSTLSGRTDNENLLVDQGWVYYPASITPPTSIVLDTITIAAQPTPWSLVPLSGGLKVAQTDSDLPSAAPAGEVWIVLSSANSGGEQGLYAFDQGAMNWQELGGGAGTALDLTGGTIVYPRSYFFDGEVPVSLNDPTLPRPQIAGDTLWSRNQAGYPVCVAMSRDGTAWTGNHPQRLTYDMAGSGKPAKADYPMQMNVGIVGGKAKITHIANRSRDWIPVAEPVIPPTIRAERAKVYTNRTRSDFRAIHDGLRLTGQVYARSPTTMFLVLGGTQLTGGRRCDLTYDYDLHLLKEGTFTYTLVGDMGFGNDGLNGLVQLAWDDQANRIQQATVARYEIDVAIVGARVLFSAQVNYRRYGNNRHTEFLVRGFLYGSNVNRVTLAGIGFSAAADFNMNSHLMGEW